MKCIGVKIVEAVEMNAVDASINRYNVNAHIGDGYEVTYEDGYKSWTPKNVFDKAYRQINNLTFGLAIEALKLGKRVARKGWNGKDMFLYLVKGTMIDKEFIQPIQNNTGVVTFLSHIDMFTAQGTVNVGWLASQTDMLSEDWIILD
jgi:hypothetical protein